MLLFYFICHLSESFPPELQKRTWHSPIYSFFKDDVKLDHFDGRPCHYFKCAARRCKTKLGGVRRFQDSKDKSSTANLRHHARRCFGDEAVQCATLKGSTLEQSGSIFAAFSRQGQQPIKPSNRSLSNPEVRASLVRWITESCRPILAVEDRQLRLLLLAGRPLISIPSRTTCSHDIIAAYKVARKIVIKLFQDSPSRVHFDTDAWTSPNHCAFVAWTIQFECQGEAVNFMLDIVEVPEVSHHFIFLCTLG